MEHRQLLSSPIVITQGGTYSGIWESTSRGTPAVTIDTTEPVVIENSTVRGPGALIASGVSHTNVTVRNTSGYGMNPNVKGAIPGRFIDLENFDNAVVQNNYLESTAGIYLLSYAGDHTLADTIKVTGNTAKNIDGRRSDGNGGWMDFNTRTRKSDGYTEDGYDNVQFLQFDKVAGVAGIDIGWNQVVNEPGNSRVEDNISIYKSSGTSSSPISIHDNFIQGAYTIKPWQADTSDSTYTYDWSYSGGGIMLGDGVGTGTTDPSYIKAFDNTVVSTTNYGIAISAGHDSEFYNNRIVSAGVLADGRKIANQNVGAYVWDSYGAGSSHFYNDKGHDNTIGWVQGSGRNDWWSPVGSNMPNNTSMAGPITLTTEQAEYAAWLARATAAGVTVSKTPVEPVAPEPTTNPPADGTTPTTTPTPTTPPPTTTTPPTTTPTPTPPPPPTPAPVQLKGTVFTDWNGDGKRATREPATAGRVVYVDLNNNSRRDAGEPAATTTASGQYTLSVVPGTYKLRQVLPAGWYETAPAHEADHGVTVSTAGAAGPVNFGAARYSSISGTVFRDADRDGHRDAGEAGLPGWTVFIDANNNGWRDANETKTLTRSDGSWSFGKLKVGIYNIRVQQLNWSVTRTSVSYFKHQVWSGTTFGGDNFGYAPR